MVTVYCYGMFSSNPKEYLNLPSVDNYSLLYRFQLKDNSSCPSATFSNKDIHLKPKIRGGKTIYR